MLPVDLEHPRRAAETRFFSLLVQPLDCLGRHLFVLALLEVLFRKGLMGFLSRVWSAKEALSLVLASRACSETHRPEMADVGSRMQLPARNS